MKLFKGSKKLKDELIKEIKEHQKADRYHQRDGYDEIIGMGCHYNYKYKIKDNAREEFSDKYGVDLWYVYLTEIIFEKFPVKEFENYPLESIEVFLKDGKLPKTVNWNKIKSEFFYNLLEYQLKYCENNQSVTDYVEMCRNLFIVPFNEIDKKVALEYAKNNFDGAVHVPFAPYDAADIARATADIAANVATATATGYATGYAIVAAADVISVAAGGYAKKNHYIWMRDLLFKCVKNNITF